MLLNLAQLKHDERRASKLSWYRFFNDMMSQGSFSGFWHIMRAFYDGDAYLALPFGVKFIDEVVRLYFSP